MELRKITKKDKPAIYKLAVEQNKLMRSFSSYPVYEVKFTKAVFSRLFSSSMKRSHFFQGIEEDGEIIAVVSGYIKPAPNGDVGYLDNVMITEKAQGKGIATMLRDGFYKWLKHKNVKYCQLEVLAKNHQAIHIYEKWGFTTDGYQMTKRI